MAPAWGGGPGVLGPVVAAVNAYGVTVGTLQIVAAGFGVLWALLNAYTFYPLARTVVEGAVARLRTPRDSRGRARRRERASLTLPAVDVDGGREGVVQSDLPEIDVLLPAYEEAAVIAQSIRSVRETDYPQELLNLYVLLEDDDRRTLQTLSTLDLRYEFTELVIPSAYPGEPNKPRALNFGFEHSTGDVVGVVDAEDVVAPGVFREVVDSLVVRGNDFALGHLDMANEDDGWLNLQFRAEYGWWYEIVVPAYRRVGYPVPLGGTTCFFGRSVLDAVASRRVERFGPPSWSREERLWLSGRGYAGAVPWDPENVTEDFDLGLLLWEEGYRFDYLDSVTLEESPTTLDGWLGQRTRWQLGKLYTLFQYRRAPSPSLRKRLHVLWQSLLPHFGPVNVAGVVLVLMMANFVGYRPAPVVKGVLGLGLTFALVVTALTGYGYWTVSGTPLATRGRRLAVVALTLPAYWLLQWGADLRALRRAYVGRFGWEKTPHEGRHVAEGRSITPASVRRTGETVLSPRRRWAGLAAVLLVAAAVRVYGLGEWSLWFDEAYSVAVRGSLPVFDLLVVPRDPHPPLYYLLLHYWMELFGGTAWSARLLSALLSVGAVGVVFLLGAELFDDRVGLLGALLFALSSFHVHLGRTARMYALFALLTAASWYWFARLRDGSRASAVGYLLTTVGLVYTHAFAVFVVLAQNLHVVLSESNGGVEWRRWTALQGLLGLAALPLAWLVGRSLLRGGAPGTVDWIPAPSPAALTGTLLAYAGFPSHYPVLAGSAFTWTVALLVVFVFAACLVASVVTYDPEEGGYRLSAPERTGQLALLFVVPVAVPYLVSRVWLPVYVPRYTVPASVGLSLLVAKGAVNLPDRRWRRGTVAVLVAASVVLVGTYHAGGTVEDWEGAVDRVEEEAHPGDLLVVQPAWARPSVEVHYDGPDVTVEGVPGDGEQSPDDARRLRRLAGDHEQVWVVRYGAGGETVRSALDTTHAAVTIEEYGAVTLYRFEADASRTT